MFTDTPQLLQPVLLALLQQLAMLGLQLFEFILQFVMPGVQNTDLEAQSRACDHKVRQRKPTSYDHRARSPREQSLQRQIWL